MGLSATVYNFEVKLSDSDRSVYQALAFRVAKHPSETDEFLITRVLAYCLEYGEGLSFSKGGLSDPDVPALAVHDLTGALVRWIEIGLPESARLHRASKASPQVVVYSHKDVSLPLARLAGEKIHRADEIQISTFDRELIAALCANLTRRMRFDLVVTERQLYISIGEDTISGAITRHRIGEA
jgi:uncharacterized protein YaeQ